jgi:hypothetical protein
MFAISIYGIALLNGEIFTFVSKFAAFYAANIELWLHKPPTAKNVDRNFVLYLFFHKLNFPFRKTRNFFGDFKS